jgi:iron complex transport system substrate-binding protein
LIKRIGIISPLIMAAILFSALSAGASSYTLLVYGNANMDDTIDQADVSYLEKEIKGQAESTKLSDANDDGAVDEQDIAQVEKIINGSEEFLVVLDDTGSSIRIPEPVESFVYHGHNSYVYETVRAIGASDRIIGITGMFVRPGDYRYSEAYFPELSSVTNVGDTNSVNYEVINNLAPDVVLTDAREYYDPTKTPDTAVVALDVNISNSKEAAMRYGYIFGKVSEAKEYVNWMNDLENMIQEKTKDIPESKRPLTYINTYNKDTTKYSVPAKNNYRSLIAKNAGAKYIGDELEGSGTQSVDTEWVISRDPQVFIFSAANSVLGYDVTNPQNATDAIDDFLKRPEVANVDAVKNKRIYMLSHTFILCGGASGLLGSLYCAKWLYPDVFEDVDVQAIHQEYVSRFQRLNLDIKKCICVYPLPS